MNSKPIVFFIMPFGESFLDLYDYLKEVFKDQFEFTNGGDLDNQTNILQDIVEGIYNADVIVCDLSNLNPNVFYELGLAHAMNKKVIIITQDLDELPFDIKSYRTNEYSLQFNKLPKLVEELDKLLNGAIDNSVKYGNPVFDYLPNFNPHQNIRVSGRDLVINLQTNIDEVQNAIENENGDSSEKGFLDFLADISENSQKMVSEMNSLGSEMEEMNSSIKSTSNEMDRVKKQSGTLDPSFARKTCRKLASPISFFSEKLKVHVIKIDECWKIVENGYLSLMDNPFIRQRENAESFLDSISQLESMQTAIDESNEQIKGFVEVLKNNLGIERKLNKSITDLKTELESYLSMAETMASSIDRIIAKSDVFSKQIQKD